MGSLPACLYLPGCRECRDCRVCFPLRKKSFVLFILSIIRTVNFHIVKNIPCIPCIPCTLDPGSLSAAPYPPGSLPPGFGLLRGKLAIRHLDHRPAHDPDAIRPHAAVRTPLASM
jgi:hypothetical protein